MMTENKTNPTFPPAKGKKTLLLKCPNFAHCHIKSTSCLKRCSPNKQFRYCCAYVVINILKTMQTQTIFLPCSFYFYMSFVGDCLLNLSEKIQKHTKNYIVLQRIFRHVSFKCHKIPLQSDVQMSLLLLTFLDALMS